MQRDARIQKEIEEKNKPKGNVNRQAQEVQRVSTRDAKRGGYVSNPIIDNIVAGGAGSAAPIDTDGDGEVTIKDRGINALIAMGIINAPRTVKNSKKRTQESLHVENGMRRGMLTDKYIGDKNGIPQELEQFGQNFSKYSNNPKEAISHLIKEKRGQVRKALFHSEIGEIDLVWGKITNAEKHEGYGLAHIIDKHGEEIGKNIDDIIMGGKVAHKKGNTVEIVNDKYKAIIKLDWYGKEKTWVVTSFDIPHHQSITDGATFGKESDNLSSQDAISKIISNFTKKHK